MSRSRGPAKPYRSAARIGVNVIAVKFRFDLLIIAVLAVALLDTVTTYYFVAHDLGIELNQILAPLTSNSLLWIPVYIVLPKLLVAVMPTPCRQAFAIYFLTVCGTFTINNFVGICGGPYFLDTIGPRIVQVGATVLASFCFFAHLKFERKNHTLKMQSVKTAVYWIFTFSAIEGAFVMLGWVVNA
ncbi:hypothetical protein [Planctomycetes bacterium CA13]|uniref:hypothetical protein n=1 Tax=Novipirellula herctigrandis TaxID=2527986 RepID=UPI0011B7DFA9